MSVDKFTVGKIVRALLSTPTLIRIYDLLAVEAALVETESDEAAFVETEPDEAAFVETEPVEAALVKAGLSLKAGKSEPTGFTQLAISAVISSAADNTTNTPYFLVFILSLLLNIFTQSYRYGLPIFTVIGGDEYAAPPFVPSTIRLYTPTGKVAINVPKFSVKEFPPSWSFTPLSFQIMLPVSNDEFELSSTVAEGLAEERVIASGVSHIASAGGVKLTFTFTDSGPLLFSICSLTFSLSMNTVTLTGCTHTLSTITAKTHKLANFTVVRRIFTGIN